MISEEQFLAVYRGTVRPLYAFVARRAGDGSRSLVEDTVQETYLRAVQRWRRDGLPRSPLAWLQTVAANLVTDYYRRPRPASLDQLETAPPARPADDLEATSAGLLQEGLSGIGEAQGRLIRAFHLEEKSTREIAGDLGISERAVEGRLRRARLALRERLFRLIARG